QAEGRRRRLQALRSPALLGRLHPPRRPRLKAEVVSEWNQPWGCPMNRVLWMACVLFSVVVAMARADAPKSRTDPKPPWQRLLTGEDAKKAASLQHRIEELENGDQYAEAIKRSEELLALRTKVQGAEHWETIDQKWSLTALKKVAALPAEKRAGWRKA